MDELAFESGFSTSDKSFAFPLKLKKEREAGVDSGWNTGRSETASARVEERCREAAPRERHALAARAFAVSPQKATGTTTPPRRPEGVLWGQFSKAGLMSRLGTDSRVPSWGNTGANSTKSPPGTPDTDSLTGGRAQRLVSRLCCRLPRPRAPPPPWQPSRSPSASRAPRHPPAAAPGLEVGWRAVARSGKADPQGPRTSSHLRTRTLPSSQPARAAQGAGVEVGSRGGERAGRCGAH